MVQVKVGVSLTSIFKAELLDSGSFSVDIFNGGSQALNAFQVKLFANETSPGVVWFDVGSEWTAPASGSPLKGVSKGTDVTNLSGGSSASFMVADLDGGIKAYHSVEFLASVESGETTIDLHIGRG